MGLEVCLKGFGKSGFSETVFQVGTQYRQRLSQIHMRFEQTSPTDKEFSCGLLEIWLDGAGEV